MRVFGLADKVDALRTPPRLLLPEAVADLAIAAPDELEVVQIVADACQSRMVVAAGTCSALEHRFVNGVVRAHGLPMPGQQRVRTLTDEGGRRELRDCEWEAERLVVELDGRQFHDNARQRDRDLDRDLDDVAGGRVAVRLGWGQATRRRCRTAQRLATILRRPLRACDGCQ